LSSHTDGQSFANTWRSKDLFPVLPKIGTPAEEGEQRGTYFFFLLAEEALLADKHTGKVESEGAHALVEAVWPLFACLYPWAPLSKRTADLARFMRAASIIEQCEFQRITGCPKAACKGPLEAAHIVPDRRGGSDRAWNGLWLCKAHHRLTEGLLKGSRDQSDLSRVKVKYVGG
jgi:hypothetical protein